MSQRVAGALRRQVLFANGQYSDQTKHSQLRKMLYYHITQKKQQCSASALIVPSQHSFQDREDLNIIVNCSCPID